MPFHPPHRLTVYTSPIWLERRSRRRWFATGTPGPSWSCSSGGGLRGDRALARTVVACWQRQPQGCRRQPPLLQLRRRLPERPPPHLPPCCSPVTADGYFLATASKDGQPMLRNGETGDWIGTFQGHKGAVWSCVLNDTALLAATASADFTARVWNAITGDELHQFQHKHIARSVSFAHGDSTYRLVSGGAEKILRVFDLTRPDAPPTEFAPAPDNIRTTNWIHDNTLLLVSYLDKPNVE